MEKQTHTALAEIFLVNIFDSCYDSDLCIHLWTGVVYKKHFLCGEFVWKNASAFFGACSTWELMFVIMSIYNWHEYILTHILSAQD